MKATKTMLSILVSQRIRCPRFLFVFDLKVETSSALSSFLLSYLKEELAREVCIWNVLFEGHLATDCRRRRAPSFKESLIGDSWRPTYMLHNSAYFHLTDQNSETFLLIPSSKNLFYHATEILLTLDISLRSWKHFFMGRKFDNLVCCNFLTSTIATWELSNLERLLRHRESAVQAAQEST